MGLFPNFDRKEIVIKSKKPLTKRSIPNLVNKIHKRGRDYENSISIDYLSRLNERYEAWVSTYDAKKIIIIDVDTLDFVDNKADLSSVIKVTDDKLKQMT